MEAKVAKAVSKASRAKNLGKRVKKKQQVNIQNNKTMAHLKNDLGVDGEMNETRSHVINFPTRRERHSVGKIQTRAMFSAVRKLAFPED